MRKWKNFYYWELEIKETMGKQTFGIDLKLKLGRNDKISHVNF